MDSLGEPRESQSGLFNRVKNLILKPKDEWAAIEQEPANIAGLYFGYVMILAAIPPLATLVYSLVFGDSMFGVEYRPSIASALSAALISYGLTLIGVFVLALIIDALAPHFGAVRDSMQALKLSAYAGTAAWIAGIFQLLPGIGFLGILGLYSLYLLYLGLPRLMKAPQDRAASYTLVTLIAAVLLFIVIGAVAAPVTKMLSPAPDARDIGGTLSVPGVGSLDLGKLEDAAKQAEASAQALQNGTAKPAVAVAVLQGLLPATLAGLERTEISGSSAGAGAIGGSQAEALYAKADTRVRLKITDIAAAGAIAGLGAALNVESNRQSADGYEKTETIDGRITSEKWNHGARRGSYSVMVANRFLVEAEGEATTIETLKAGVGAIAIDRLEALAH